MAGELRAPFVTLDTNAEGDPNLRVPYIVGEPLTEGDPNLRSNYVWSEPLTEGSPNLRVSFVVNEALTEGYRNLRVSFVILETLHPVQPEGVMSEHPFPGFGNSVSNPAIPMAADPFNSPLPGLAFSVYKEPMFNTRVTESSNLREDRNSLSQYPRWKFGLSYEFLEDRTGAQSSLKTILGFFTAMGGKFDSWLFKDPDDYKVEMGWQADTDGVTTEFLFMRSIGTLFYEPVGQIDTVNTIDLYFQIPETKSVPAMAPYEITVDNAADFVSDQGVTLGGTPLTKVASAPSAMQYSVNETTGVYTFNSAQASASVVITYRYDVDPADYTITAPNSVIFDSAPDEDQKLYASFQYYFVCRFEEDSMEFEKFADKLWNLQRCDFRSIIQGP